MKKIRENCIFCHKELLKTDIVYEDDLVMVFMDMDPINEGHVLLIPKDHYLDMDEIPDEVLSHLSMVAKKLVAALKDIYCPDGYSIMQNGGRFNDIGHFHLHIFPRYDGDGFGWVYGKGSKTVSADLAGRIQELVQKG
ncbi:MAG: HIT family protein [Lachnospiraceae bacterium]|nr:HIT family protein [Lachnospiraceae bacterium]